MTSPKHSQQKYKGIVYTVRYTWQMSCLVKNPFFVSDLDIPSDGKCEEMYSRQHNDTNEPTQASEDEDCDAGCEICQNGVFPIANGDSSGVLPDREDACRSSIHDKDEDEAPLQVGSTIPDEDASASLSLSVDDDAARRAINVPDTAPCKSFPIEVPLTKTLPDGSAAQTRKTSKAEEGGDANNPIVIEDEDDGVGISPSHSPGKGMERKRRRSLDSEGDDMLPKSKVRYWE